MAAVIAILEETLLDEKLKISVIGGMLAEIDELGENADADACACPLAAKLGVMLQ